MRATLPRPSIPAAASLLVNGLLIAALMTLGMGGGKRVVDSPALSVLPLAALKGGETGEESAPSAEARPPAAPSPAQAPEQTAQAVPPPPPLPSAMPALPASASSSSVAAPTPVAAQNPASSPSSSPAAAAQGSTSAPAQTARRGIAEGLDADAPAGKSLAYAAKVRSWLYAHKIYPRRARMMRQEGVVQVRFTLDRTGALLDGVVIGSSGKATLDEEAKAMMRRASPYPRAPETITGNRLEFTAPIEFALPV